MDTPYQLPDLTPAQERRCRRLHDALTTATMEYLQGADEDPTHVTKLMDLMAGASMWLAGVISLVCQVTDTPFEYILEAMSDGITAGYEERSATDLPTKES